MATQIVLAVFLYLFVSVAVAQQRQSQTRLSEAQQCRLQQIRRSQPSQRIQSEGGVIELWDEEEDQFQCAGVAAMKNVLRPKSLSLPNFHPSPRLVYIHQGRGFMGMSFPGCAETFHSERAAPTRESWEEQERRGKISRDQHQKVQRISQGDIIAVPAGVTHWCFNDGNEDLIAIAVHDLNNQANQLDQRLRSFYLAGGAPSQGQRGQESFQNIFRAFDTDLLAEAYNVPREIIRKMQKENERGLIVQVQGEMRVLRPDEGQQHKEEEEERREQGPRDNGLEETFCTMKFRQNINTEKEAEVYSRRAGRINVVNQHKLPILRSMDMSAERGNLFPNAMYTPHWSMNGHSAIYVTQGDAQVQIVDNNGDTVFNDRVNQGDMFIIPQFLVSTARAGENGFEWVSFKTTSQPLKSPLSGYTSVMRAMPLQVITNSFQISPNEAQNLKHNRGQQTLLLSPRTSS